jgi:hypothetical protein
MLAFSGFSTEQEHPRFDETAKPMSRESVAALNYAIDDCECIKSIEYPLVAFLKAFVFKRSYRTASYPPGIPPFEYTI